MASDTDAKALGEALRSEYSAIFGYGVVSAYVSDTYNSSVATVWSAHRARRDRIIHIIESQMRTSRNRKWLIHPLKKCGIALPLCN